EAGSPACLMHLIDPVSGRAPPDGDRQQWIDVMRWRKAERERLIALRLAIPAEERRRCSESIAEGLDRVLGHLAGRTVSVYWPFRGEPDLRPWMERLSERGATCALPVVIAPRTPLAFRAWRRGEPLKPGVWNIPAPAEGPDIEPDIVLAPVVGFDRACYRLGHGGGFFDRTLAILSPRPRIVGVGYARLSIPTIFPQAHDIPMDLIVTEEGIVRI
ncbi:MAG: 5-formyltetrahydrofolate cyclo-ligase, partial [Alphaproteobacteria bacterium]|nr:5-formyltetrahydrofolate cyclo-ligase [Alphaproteobacteria bacterium]